MKITNEQWNALLESQIKWPELQRPCEVKLEKSDLFTKDGLHVEFDFTNHSAVLVFNPEGKRIV